MKGRVTPLFLGFVISTLPLTGCLHAGKAAKGPSSADATVTPASLASLASAEEMPAGYDDYYVGPFADPNDPRFMYRPGELLVQTRTPRSPASFGPSTSARMANDHPEPTETELAAMAFRSQRTISALAEENERLVAQVKALRDGTMPPPGKKADPAVSPERATDPSVVQAKAAVSGDGELNLVAPNADGVIELDPNLFAPPATTTTNPFVQLYQPPVALHEIDLAVSAAMPGPAPSAIIDDAPVGIGDRVRELTVWRIDADTVYLKKDSFLLACPVSQKPLKLRLP
jgi:hypothetical protein